MRAAASPCSCWCRLFGCRSEKVERGELRFKSRLKLTCKPPAPHISISRSANPRHATYTRITHNTRRSACIVELKYGTRRTPAQGPRIPSSEGPPNSGSARTQTNFITHRPNRLGRNPPVTANCLVDQEAERGPNRAAGKTPVLSLADVTDSDRVSETASG